MTMTKATIIALFVISSLPFIVLFTIGRFAWRCAKVIVKWLTADF